MGQSRYAKWRSSVLVRKNAIDDFGGSSDDDGKGDDGDDDGGGSGGELDRDHRFDMEELCAVECNAGTLMSATEYPGAFMDAKMAFKSLLSMSWCRMFFLALEHSKNCS